MEILKHIKWTLPNETDDITHILDLCAAPGGFSEYLTAKYFHHVHITAISLNRSIKFSKFTNDYFVKKQYANVITDELNLNNKYMLVLADGSISHKNDENNKELNSIPLIFAEFKHAINNIANGGTFIVKTFNVYSEFMMDLIYYTAMAFEKIKIFKPYSSRSSNDERYIIFSNYINEMMMMTPLNLLDVSQYVNGCGFLTGRSTEFDNYINDSSLKITNMQYKIFTLAIANVKYSPENIERLSLNKTYVDSVVNSIKIHKDKQPHISCIKINLISNILVLLKTNNDGKTTCKYREDEKFIDIHLPNDSVLLCNVDIKTNIFYVLDAEKLASKYVGNMDYESRLKEISLFVKQVNCLRLLEKDKRYSDYVLHYPNASIKKHGNKKIKNLMMIKDAVQHLHIRCCNTQTPQIAI